MHAAGVIMLAGSDLVMAGLAVGLAAAMVTRRVRDSVAHADLAAYNAYLASLGPRAERPDM